VNNNDRKIIVGNWILHRIRLRDKEMYSYFIKQSQYPVNLWSSNFDFIWADAQSVQKQVYWKIVDGMLVTFAFQKRYGLYLLCLPFGSGDPDQVLHVVYRCLQFCNRWNRSKNYPPATVKTVNSQQLEFLEKSEYFRKFFEYVKLKGIERHFSVKNLVELKGNSFQRIRNAINRFNRNYPQTIFRRYTPKDYKPLLLVSQNWKKTAGSKYSVIFDDVYFHEILKHQAELDHLIIVAEMDGKIVGMASGGILPTGQSWGCLIKKLADINDLNEKLIVEFAKEIHRIDPNVELMNVGSDLGAEGLIAFKEKFRPVLNLERYRIALKQK
jgi:hypothetical protein